MSLWRYKTAIARAVLGELAPKAELTLRAHLRGCDACRNHYNAMSMLAGPEVAARRERARVINLVGPITEPLPTRRWLWAVPVLVPALALALWLRPVSSPEIEAPVWRGGSEGEAPAWPLSLLLYGFAKGAPPTAEAPQILGELPFSKGITVPRGQLAQFGYKALKAATHLTIVGEQGGKRVTLFPRRPQDQGPLGPSLQPKALGSSLDLNAAFGVGRIQLWVAFSERALAKEQIEALVQAGSDAKQFRVYKESITLLP